jgi:hypothetical protein
MGGLKDTDLILDNSLVTPEVPGRFQKTRVDCSEAGNRKTPKRLANAYGREPPFEIWAWIILRREKCAVLLL